MPEIIDTDTCHRCRATIYLVQTGRSGCKWLTSPRNIQSWHCGNLVKFPTRAHSPRE